MLKIFESKLDLKEAFFKCLEEIKNASYARYKQSSFGYGFYDEDYYDDEYDNDYDSDFLREFHQNQPKIKSVKNVSKPHPVRGSGYEEDESNIDDKLEDVKDIYFYPDVEDEESLEIYTSLQELSEGLSEYDVVYDVDATKTLMKNFKIFCTIITKNVNGQSEKQLIASTSYGMLLQKFYQETDYYFD